MKSIDLENLGKLIKSERKRRGLSQADVAKGIKAVSGLETKQNTISEWETGLRNPGFLGIYHLCRFWEITIDELLGLTKEQTLHIELTEAEREAIVAMFDECKEESDFEGLRRKLGFLEQYVKGLLTRAQKK